MSFSPRTAARKTLIIGAALLLLGYLLFSRGFWFSELERQAQRGTDRLSKSVDLSRADKIVWTIKADDWKYTGECEVALVLDRPSDIPDAAYRKESRALKVRVDAYAVLSPSAGPDKQNEGPKAPRLIRNWYFTTDEPFSPSARIWETWGNGVELGLCGVNRYPFEDTFIVVDVIEPDPLLTKANPRLEIVGEHDYAVYEHLRVFRVFRDIVLTLLAFCVIGLSYAGIKKAPERKSADLAD